MFEFKEGQLRQLQLRSLEILKDFKAFCDQHGYMTAGKTIALTRRTFVGKVMSLLLNMLSRLVVQLSYFKF